MTAEEYFVRARAAGFDEHLVKPISADALLEALATIPATEQPASPRPNEQRPSRPDRIEVQGTADSAERPVCRRSRSSRGLIGQYSTLAAKATLTMAFAAGIMKQNQVRIGTSAALLTVLGWSFARAQEPKLVVLPCTERFGQFDAQTRPIARCGTVTVPQDRAAPKAPNLKTVVLPVVVYAAPAARGTPVLFLDGGPGGSAIAAAQEVLFRTPFGQLILQGRNSSRSTAAEYRPRNTARRRTWVRRLPGAYPRGQSLSALRDSVARLAKALRTRGVAPKNFTTLAAVDDIADVLHALGYNRVMVFGASYGSREALHFVRRHPEMVESMILDGVAPPEATTLLDSATIVNAGRAIVSRIVDDCRTDDACRYDYADLARGGRPAFHRHRRRLLHRTANFPDNGGWRTLEARGAAILNIVGMASTRDAIRAEAPRILVELASQDTLRSSSPRTCSRRRPRIQR